MTCTTPIGPGLLKPGIVRQCDLPTTRHCEDCAIAVCHWHAAAGHFKHNLVDERDAMNTTPTEDE